MSLERKYLPLRYLQFINSHYDSLEQQIQNTYEINAGVVLFATPAKIFCINLNADDILLTSIELDEERYSKTDKLHFNLTHFHDREINDGWAYRIICPTFNLFWRQILRSVTESFNIQSAGLLKLLEDYPDDVSFDLVSPNNCTESEDKEQTAIIINNKVTQFPLFLNSNEEFVSFNLSLNQNIVDDKIDHFKNLNYLTDKSLCAVQWLINENRIVSQYKNEEFKAFLLSLSENLNYWREISNMDIFLKHIFSKNTPFIPIRGSFKNRQEFLNTNNSDKLFLKYINSQLDTDDIEGIASNYGYEFSKVLAIDIYSIKI